MRNPCAILACFMSAVILHGAEVPKAPVPPSPYLPVVYRYADTMIDRGRDTNGLFLSALDRRTLAPLTNRPSAPTGVREQDRVTAAGAPLIGSNPYHDENLLRLLYTLSELSGKPKYRAAADTELKWFVQHGQPPSSFRPWMLWDRCFDVAPEQSRITVSAMKAAANDTPREVGFRIRSWAVGYARTQDEEFLRLIDQPLATFERGGEPPAEGNPMLLSLAIDCDGAAHRVPEPLASRLRAVAARSGERSRTGDGSMWSVSSGPTKAQLAMLCASRYDNTGDTAYRAQVHAAAEAYLNSLPPENEDVWAMTLGQAISLQVAAWRSTAQPKYLARARVFADLAVERFFDGSPLARASLKTDHYETITGTDTLALALVELHLQILHITAVRCPPNTIDR